MFSNHHGLWINDIVYQLPRRMSNYICGEHNSHHKGSSRKQLLINSMSRIHIIYMCIFPSVPYHCNAYFMETQRFVDFQYKNSFKVVNIEA